MEAMGTLKVCQSIKGEQVREMVVTSHSENDELDGQMNHYFEIRQLRNAHIHKVWDDPIALNQFHDTLIKATVQKAIKKIESEFGAAPAHFTFFIMGSGGRSEQSIWSDQDHGIIFKGEEIIKPYFLTLGKEISQGLYEVGYEFCDGRVMSSNPRWCHSMNTWKEQVINWLDEASWESLRYFSTFFDSKVIIGDDQDLLELKEMALEKLKGEPLLLNRLYENISHIKKGIGILGQLLPNTKGKETGSINIKEVIFFPYVNSLRLLSIKEGILEPSTLARFQQLPDSYSKIKVYQYSFLRLLHLRLHYKKNANSYEDVHFLDIHTLKKSEKHELKQIMKNGYRLLTETKEIIHKGCSS